MRQKLCRRLEELEKISAAALQASMHAVGQPDARERLARALQERTELMEEVPPELLAIRVREVKALLWQCALGDQGAHV